MLPFLDLLTVQQPSSEEMSYSNFSVKRENAFLHIMISMKSIYFFFFLPPDIEKLCTFSQRFPLPSMYRALVWKVLLGMILKSWELLSSKMSN